MRPGVPAASGDPVLGRTPASGVAGLSRTTVAGGERRAETQVSPTAYLYSRVRFVDSFVLFDSLCSLISFEIVSFNFPDPRSVVFMFLSIRVRILPNLNLHSRLALIPLIGLGSIRCRPKGYFLSPGATAGSSVRICARAATGGVDMCQLRRRSGDGVVELPAAHSAPSRSV